MRRIQVPTTDSVRRALANLAEREHRDPRDLAAILIAEGLHQRGALTETKTVPVGEPALAAR